MADAKWNSSGQVDGYKLLFVVFFPSMPSCIGEFTVAQLVSRRTFGIHYAYAVSKYRI